MTMTKIPSRKRSYTYGHGHLKNLLQMGKKGSICHFSRAFPASIWGRCSPVLVCTNIWGCTRRGVAMTLFALGFPSVGALLDRQTLQNKGKHCKMTNGPCLTPHSCPPPPVCARVDLVLSLSEMITNQNLELQSQPPFTGVPKGPDWRVPHRVLFVANLKICFPLAFVIPGNPKQRKWSQSAPKRPRLALKGHDQPRKGPIFPE